jgi:hypothetical protein
MGLDVRTALSPAPILNPFLSRLALASDLFEKDKTQHDSGVVWDVDKNWGNKRGVPLGTPHLPQWGDPYDRKLLVALLVVLSQTSPY